jgi:hypothetical protein
MSPFRLFGHAPDAPSAAPDLDTDLGRDADVSWAPGPWTAGRGDEAAGTATRHARPVAFGRGAGPARVDDDPPTDPYGFPPLPAAPVERMPELRPVPATSAPPPPDPLEAAALAGAFAVDYLSWDEDDPGRRARSLADHLAAPVADPGRLGWDGRGRQRADFALPGLVRADGDDRVLVDVRVRVTPYREVGAAADRAADRRADGAEAADAEPDVPGTPAAAPAPTGRGWRGCAASWVRLSVPVVREDGRLGVDAADEASEPATDIGDTEERDAADRDDRSTTVGTTVHPLPGEREPDDRPLRAPLANPESAW